MKYDEITNSLLWLSATVLMSRENDLSNIAIEGLPLAVIDTIQKNTNGYINFMAYVQLNAAYFDPDLSFELAVLKVGSEDADNNYYGVTLKRYKVDNVKRNIAGKHYDANGASDILTADRFKDSMKFIESFSVPVKEAGRYALAVLVNFDKDTQILLDAYYFKVI